MMISSVSIRIWAPLAAAAAGALLLYIVLGIAIPGSLAAQPILQGLAQGLSQVAGYAALALLFAGAVRTVLTYVHYRQWMNGEIPSCPRCGEAMQQRNGRFGMFWGCMSYPRCRGTRHL